MEICSAEPHNFFIITGPMGSGKSTILRAAALRGMTTVNEPARQILTEQRSFGGRGVPEINPALFTELMVSRSLRQFMNRLDVTGPVLFDRGLPDMLGYATYFKLKSKHIWRAARTYRYNGTVFALPEWEAIYTTDAERKLSFAQACEFWQSLRRVYSELAYDLVEVPKGPVQARLDFISEVIRKTS